MTKSNIQAESTQTSHEHMIIVFDFDDTLFETKRFKVDLFQMMATQLAVSIDAVAETYDVAKKDAYSLEQHIALLKQQFPEAQDQALRSALPGFFAQTKEYLFDDVMPVLHSLKSRGATLMLLTYGDHDFQSQKIASTGLVELCEKIVITTDAKSQAVKELFRDTHRMIALDNTLAHLHDIKQEVPAVETVAVNRYGEIAAFEAFPHEFVTDLHEFEARLIK